MLSQEEFLLPPADDLVTYVEFVAVYLELRYFAAGFLRSYFPSLEEFHFIDELIRQDLDAESLLAATRLAGAAEPEPAAEVPALDRHGWRDRFDEAQPPPAPRRLARHKRSEAIAASLIRRAEAASGRGNHVRAAIRRTQAARHATAAIAHEQRELARAELSRLTRRLQAALGFTDNEARRVAQVARFAVGAVGRRRVDGRSPHALRPAIGVRRP